MQGDIVSILISFLLIVAVGIIVRYGLWFYDTLNEKGVENGKKA